MSAPKPYRLLRDPDFVAKFNAAFAALGLEVSDHFDPGNAYAPALVKFKNLNDPSVNVVVQFDRVWWEDERNFEDAKASLKIDGSMVAEIDVTALLRDKLSVPLTDYIIDELVSEAQGVA